MSYDANEMLTCKATYAIIRGVIMEMLCSSALQPRGRDLAGSSADEGPVKMCLAT